MAGERGLFFYIFFVVICFYLCYCFFLMLLLVLLREGRQNTPHRAELSLQMIEGCFSIYLFLLLFSFHILILLLAGKISSAGDRGLFFDVFVVIAVFFYHDGVVVDIFF